MFKTGWLLQKWEVRSSLSTAQRVLLVLELPKLSGKRTSDTGWHARRRATLLSIEFCFTLALHIKPERRGCLTTPN